jgi:hypothetical protein
MVDVRARPRLHWGAKVAARGLSYAKRRHETNPNEDSGGDSEKTSVGNVSADGKKARLQDVHDKKQGMPL